MNVYHVPLRNNLSVLCTLIFTTILREVLFPPPSRRENWDLREVTEPLRGRVRIPPQVCVAPKPSLIKDAALINVIRNSKTTTLQPVVLRFALSPLMARLASLIAWTLNSWNNQEYDNSVTIVVVQRAPDKIWEELGLGPDSASNSQFPWACSKPSESQFLNLYKMVTKRPVVSASLLDD